MSTTLYHTSASKPDAAALWSKVTAIAKEGVVPLSDTTVYKAASLLHSAALANGQRVTAYAWKDDFSFVSAFGPALLEEATLTQLRHILSSDGETAASMLDIIVELGIQIELVDDEDQPPHLKAVNWAADDVDFRLANGQFDALLTVLGIQQERNTEVGKVDLATFEAAVAENGHDTGHSGKLKAFIECAKRHNASTIYWA